MLMIFFFFWLQFTAEVHLYAGGEFQETKEPSELQLSAENMRKSRSVLAVTPIDVRHFTVVLKHEQKMMPCSAFSVFFTPTHTEANAIQTFSKITCWFLPFVNLYRYSMLHEEIQPGLLCNNMLCSSISRERTKTINKLQASMTTRT